MLRLVKELKTDSKVEGGRCMRGSDGKLCFSENERGKVRKDYVERIMNEENDRDHVEGDAVEQRFSTGVKFTSGRILGVSGGEL